MLSPNNLIDISDLFLGKKRPRKILKSMQDIEFSLTFLLTSIVMKKFEWKGLPEELKNRDYLIEYILFWYGSGVLLKRNDKYLFLPAYLSSSLNMYGEATEVHAYGLNGQDFGKVYIRNEYDENLNLIHEQDAVLFKNNQVATREYDNIKTMISRLVYIWQSLGIQNGLSRLKLLVYANQDLCNKVNETIETILGDSNLTFSVPNEEGNSLISDVKESNFGGQYSPEQLWFDFDKTLELLLTFEGIKGNIESNKSAKQTLREVSSGDFLARYSAHTRYDMRLLAIEEVKSIFNLTLTCEDMIEKEVMEEEKERALAFTGGEEGKGTSKNEKSKSDFKKPTPNKKG